MVKLRTVLVLDESLSNPSIKLFKSLSSQREWKVGESIKIYVNVVDYNLSDIVGIWCLQGAKGDIASKAEEAKNAASNVTGMQ